MSLERFDTEWFGNNPFRTRQPTAAFRQLLEIEFRDIDPADIFSHSRLGGVYRDAQIAAGFAEARSAISVCLASAGARDDFEIELSSGEVTAYQATEVMDHGRRRGQEWRKWRDDGYEVQEDDGAFRSHPVYGSLMLCAAYRKLIRGHRRLVLYVNTGGYLSAEKKAHTESMLGLLIGACFEELWLLRTNGSASCLQAA